MAVTFTPTTVLNPQGVQGDYPLRLDAAHEGLIADLQAYVARTGLNESAAVIPFGNVVTLNTTGTEFSVQNISAATQQILGIAADTLAFENSAGSVYTLDSKDANGRIGYPDKRPVNVFRKGVIWVYVNETIPELNSAVRIRHAATGVKYAGRFDVTAEADKTLLVTSGATWLSTRTGPGLALLEIDIPGLTVTADA